MKKIFVISIAILFVNIVFSQTQYFDLKTNNVKGNVKSSFHKTYKVHQDEIIQKYAIKSVYNQDGLMTSKESYGSDNELDYKEIYAYKSGKIISIHIENSSGKLNKKINYEYKNGVLKSIIKTDNKGETEHKTTYLYDKKEKLLSKTKTIPKIAYTITESYVYDANTGYIVVKAKKAHVGTSKETFEYNMEGLISKKSEYNALSELFSTIDYEYNNQGDKISLKKHSPEGELTYYETYTYEYDDMGNWIKKTTTKKDKKDSEETREFVYY